VSGESEHRATRGRCLCDSTAEFLDADLGFFRVAVDPQGIALSETPAEEAIEPITLTRITDDEEVATIDRQLDAGKHDQLVQAPPGDHARSAAILS
jgi:hypothetical protein